jgi:hypothetical protein
MYGQIEMFSRPDAQKNEENVRRFVFFLRDGW